MTQTMMTTDNVHIHNKAVRSRTVAVVAALGVVGLENRSPLHPCLSSMGQGILLVQSGQ